MIVQDTVKQTTYQRIVVMKYGGPEVLRTTEEAIPEPAAGEVGVRVLAAGVSAYDLIGRSSGLLSTALWLWWGLALLGNWLTSMCSPCLGNQPARSRSVAL